MSDIAIKFENISKQYRLGLVSTKTLSHDLNRWWQTSVLRREDPYLKIGESNDRSKKGTSDYVWALRNIDFEVKKGDVLGIIGKNGAGKSTLLKILSKVTTPTTGSIKAKGRIASLLEVGTGFHPEMTGRENIYMNGSIMGMTKAEITRKLDEIVEFAGVARYIDTPVKRYSSGMMVRLGFSVAAHLEPEILVVDEVLAVGDAEFQKKAIGKMQDVSKGEGRTVLFVSHNMGAVRNLCKTGVILKDGQLNKIGEIQSVVDAYMNDHQEGNKGYTCDMSIPPQGKKLKIRSIRVINDENEISSELNNAKNAYIEISFDVFIEGRGYDVGVHLIHVSYGYIFTTCIKDINPELNDSIVLEKGSHAYRIPLPMEILRGGDYIITVGSAIPKFEMLDEYKYETHFTIMDMISPVAKTTEGRNGAILPIIQWEQIK